MKEKIIKTNKGITLIALVITIIVLLILAGVTIATLTGENGILTRATQAEEEQADATVKEAISLAWTEYQMMINEPSGEIIENETKIASTTQVKIQGQEENYLATPSMSFLDFLKDEKGYIDENGVVDVEALTGGKLSKGNGTDGATDVYKIEEGEDTYTLKYYDEDSEEETLWTVNVGNSGDSTSTYPEATPEDKFYYFETEDGVILTGFDITGETLTVLYHAGTGNFYLETGEVVGNIQVGSVSAPAFYKLISNEAKTDIVLPKTINSKEIVSLQSSRGFFYNSNIRTITIPYSVKEISSNMFSSTPYLTTISFPEGKNPELEIPADKWGADESVQILGKNGEILE